MTEKNNMYFFSTKLNYPENCMRLVRYREKFGKLRNEVALIDIMFNLNLMRS
jgi:hypothetical protein